MSRARSGRSAGGGKSAKTSAEADAAKKSLEIELKLAGQAEALESLWKSAPKSRSKANGRRLISTYFDTSDFRLRRRGFTLRIRQDGNAFEQTIKAQSSEPSSVMRRNEWSAPIDGLTPDLRKLDDAEAREKIGLVIAGELQPIFTTDITRETKTYRANGKSGKRALIEAALDRGEIRCDDKREPISEIELELLEGSAVTLQKEAVRFLQETALQYQPLSKSDRGFALALGERPKSQKAGLPKLTREASVEEGLEQVLAHCVNHWLANHAAVLDGGDVEGVHQMRVAMRRMRSALTILKGALPADDRAWLQREARFLIGDLGAARDWDVFIGELLQPVLDARGEDANLEILRAAVNEQRRRAYDRAQAALRSPRYLRFVLELGAWLDGKAWRGKGGKAARARLDRRMIDLADEVLQKRHKGSLKLGRKFDRLSDEALHRLRISLKKLRYSTEFFATLYGSERTKAYLTSLRQLQDDLGHLNDVAVAETRLGELCAQAGEENLRELHLACGAVIGWYSHVLAEVRPRIAKDWRAFTHTPPFWLNGGGD